MSNFIRESCPDRKSWLEARHRIPGSVGASDAASIMGYSPWRTIDQVYDELTGLKKAEDITSKACVQFGIQAEEHIRELVRLDLQDIYTIENHPFDILRMNENPFIFATLDGELTRRSDGAKGVLEIKTGNSLMTSDWAFGQIPEHYACQVCQQLLVTGWEYAIVVARLKRDNFPIASKGLPGIAWFYRYVDASDKHTAASIQAVLEADIAFHDAVISRTRPAISINYRTRSKR
ncbi:MAG: YqaJ viral recombinase family protein [Candidatus Cloacimonetes bacterium]|nr:YqaJ viral recombinase family protein [Candidatus Cloacimonadota bacterium]